MEGIYMKRVSMVILVLNLLVLTMSFRDIWEPKQVYATTEKAIASFSTPVDTSDQGKVHNIQLACKKLNGFMLKPNETFSFNHVIGNSNDPQDGWKVSKIILNNRFVPGYGGGVCQVSTTLFNSAQQAHLQVVERHHHSMNVPYIAKGLDATVAYPYFDLKFINTHPYPIKIKAYMRHNRLFVSIYEIK
jgi:vancomycin resistance protein YoaR